MSISYGFYNSVGGDRKYNATQMSSLFDGVIRDGVFASIGSALSVIASSGMTINVKEGRAWFNHTWTNNDAEIVLTVPQSELVLNRIDAVVLEINSNDDTRENSIKIVKGTPATNPVPPILSLENGLYQYPLSYIYVASGVASIAQANITNKVGSTDCPFVTGILETVNTDLLLQQWDSEFQLWFDGIKDVLNESAEGNLLNKINNLIVKGTSTIPKIGWAANTGDNSLKVSIPIIGVNVGDWVDVTIDKDYQDVAQAAEINSTVDEYDGGIIIYANNVPTSDIPIRYKVVN